MLYDIVSRPGMPAHGIDRALFERRYANLLSYGVVHLDSVLHASLVVWLVRNGTQTTVCPTDGHMMVKVMYSRWQHRTQRSPSVGLYCVAVDAFERSLVAVFSRPGGYPDVESERMPSFLVQLWLPANSPLCIDTVFNGEFARQSVYMVARQYDELCAAGDAIYAQRRGVESEHMFTAYMNITHHRNAYRCDALFGGASYLMWLMDRHRANADYAGVAAILQLAATAQDDPDYDTKFGRWAAANVGLPGPSMTRCMAETFTVQTVLARDFTVPIWAQSHRCTARSVVPPHLTALGFTADAVDAARRAFGRPDQTYVFLVPHWSAGQCALSHMMVTQPEMMRYYGNHWLGGEAGGCGPIMFYVPPPPPPGRPMHRAGTMVAVDATLYRRMVLSVVRRTVTRTQRSIAMHHHGQRMGWYAGMLAGMVDGYEPELPLTDADRVILLGGAPKDTGNGTLDAWIALETLSTLLSRRNTNGLLYSSPNLTNYDAYGRANIAARWFADVDLRRLLERLFGVPGANQTAHRLTMRQKAELVTTVTTTADDVGGVADVTMPATAAQRADSLVSFGDKSQPLVGLVRCLSTLVTEYSLERPVLRAVRALVRRLPGLRERHPVYEHLFAYVESAATTVALATLDPVRDAERIVVCGGVVPSQLHEPENAAAMGRPRGIWCTVLGEWYPYVAAALLRLCGEPDVPGWFVVHLVRSLRAGATQREETDWINPVTMMNAEETRIGRMPPAFDPLSVDEAASLERYPAVHVLANVVQRLAYTPVRTTSYHTAKRLMVPGCRMRPVGTTYPPCVMRNTARVRATEVLVAVMPERRAVMSFVEEMVERYGDVHDPNATAACGAGAEHAAATAAADAAWRGWFYRRPVGAGPYPSRSTAARDGVSTVLAYDDAAGPITALNAWPVDGAMAFGSSMAQMATTSVGLDVIMMHMRDSHAIVRIAPE